MKKTIKIIAVSSGVVGALSAVVLGCIYLKDITGYIKNVKRKLKI